MLSELTLMIFSNVSNGWGCFLFALYVLQARANPAQLTKTFNLENFDFAIWTALLASVSEATYKQLENQG